MTVGAPPLSGGRTASYRVAWDIDVEAPSVVEAAREAFRVMQDPDTTATAFVVEIRGRAYTVDLRFDDALARVTSHETGKVVDHPL